MNLNDIHKLSSKEIVQSMARMIGSPIEKALKAELDIRFAEAVTDLSENIYSLRLSLDSIAKTNRTNKSMMIFIVLLLIIITAILVYFCSG